MEQVPAFRRSVAADPMTRGSAAENCVLNQKMIALQVMHVILSALLLAIESLKARPLSLRDKPQRD
jgi:hypothetical protein